MRVMLRAASHTLLNKHASHTCMVPGPNHVPIFDVNMKLNCGIYLFSRKLKYHSDP